MKGKENIVEIDFESTFSKNGLGLMYKDIPSTVPGQEPDRYVFEWSEMYGKRNIFPNFEQPNIRGRFKLNVAAPMEWEVISNEKKVATHPYKLNTHYQAPLPTSHNTGMFKQVSTTRRAHDSS
jgi:aminopeptidase N